MDKPTRRPTERRLRSQRPPKREERPMALPAPAESVHFYNHETGAIACSDADSPYVAELTDDPARVTCAPCRESIADSPHRSLAPANSLNAALDALS